jgi:hypothetical protein
MNEHETITVFLKAVEVDKEIVPVVEWLNGFPDIYTKWSCQGDDNESPYVVFNCDAMEELLKVVRKMEYFGRVEIRAPNDIRVLDYTLVFTNTQALKNFVEGLQHVV